ncbi:MAG TPA: hypothetical protein VMT00_05890 [Thermoanaerobaculia bacterium]|nr:hypothetical protein [Thermoanaerobaculia bacterium]
MSGMIEGGWSFVWAAYGITALILVVYTISLIRRISVEQRIVDRSGAGEDEVMR